MLTRWHVIATSALMVAKAILLDTRCRQYMLYQSQDRYHGTDGERYHMAGAFSFDGAYHALFCFC